MPPCTPFLRPLAAARASRQRSGAAQWSGAGFEAAQWRGEVISIPGRVWQPCVAPYFATRGRGDMRGTKSPNKIAPRRWCVAVQPPRQGCWAAPCGGRGAMRGAGIADISRNACRRYAPCSLHAHPSHILSQLLIFLKNNCEKIWWIRQKAITLHSQSNARCHSSVGRAKD